MELIERQDDGSVRRRPIMPRTRAVYVGGDRPAPSHGFVPCDLTPACTDLCHARLDGSLCFDTEAEHPGPPLVGGRR
jgi:hypothetical protein